MDALQREGEMLGNLMVSPDLWANLVYLCDRCNGRFAGTDDERRAGDFILARFRAAGLANVHAEPFEMRGWERGEARLALLDGEREISLPCLALPGTQGCDLEAEIIDIGPGTAADYERLGAAVAGKIVLTSAEGPSRGEKYQGAIRAGAVAFLFSNTQPGMLALTGSIRDDLPAVGLAYEQAERIRRQLQHGAVCAHLSIDARVQTVTARNIVGEIPGADPQQGWILACGHYDGHDIAQGAQDNAAGTAVLMEAARLLAPLRKQLQVGVRFVLFSGEELGLYGSYAYARQHADQHDTLRAVFNADVVGMAMPLVLQMQSSPELAAYFRSLPLAELDAVVDDGPKSFIMNSDHFPFALAGIATVMAVTTHPKAPQGWVHTPADTLDKVEPRVLRQTAASVTRLLLRMASDSAHLPRGRKSAAAVEQVLKEAGFEKALRSTDRWPF